jgi:hypothetical protein
MLEQRRVNKLIEELVDLIEQQEKKTTRPEKGESIPQPEEKGGQGQIGEK